LRSRDCAAIELTISPVLVLANGAEQIIRKGLALGANSFLTCRAISSAS